MSRSKITIVTVVYNAVETLEATIASVLEQSYQYIEYIIIDGLSTDGTIEIINRYKNKLANYISEPDKGIYDAMNKALSLATGDWLLFLGADDILYNANTIENMVSVCIDKDNLYYGNVYLKQSKIIYNGKTNKWRLAYGNVSHQAIFYPKCFYKKYKYELKYPIFADHIYNIKLYANYARRFVYVNEIITIYNENGFSSTSNDKMYFTDINIIIGKCLGIGPRIYAQFRKSIAKFR